MSDWQPIETVPENTRVLVWTQTNITPDAIAYVENVCDGEHIFTTQVGEFWEGDWHNLQLIGTPICWQPLPKPPAA
jgi:hypothetical protein